jgi:polysaccharide biosynthesis transport protein
MASLPTDRAQPRARQPEDELSLAELLQVVGRRRWLLLGCIFLGGLAGMAALGALTPVYDARALLIIEPDSGARTGATVPTASQTPDSASVDSQVQILASRSLAREAIQALGLAADPELAGSGSSGALAALLRRQTPPTPAPAADVVARFIERLSVEREGKSHVIAVSWRSADAGKAARVANKLAELYMAGQLTRKDAASRRQSGRLDAQLEALKGQLATAEATLAAYRAASEAGRAEMLGAEEGDISGLDSQLVAATVARAGKEAVLAWLNRVVEVGSDTAAAGEVGGSPMLDNLLALKADLLRREAELAGQYGQRHPKIVAIASEKTTLDDRIRTERRTLLQQYQGEVARARAGEQVLARKLQELKGMALRREATAERTQELLREVELSRRLYESYLARASSEDQATDTVEPDARLISEAVPPTEPSFPKPKLILTLTLTAGFLLGLAAMFVAETGQRGLRSEREVTEVLGLPTLGLVPRLDGARRAGIAPQDYALDRPRSRYAEALREILTGLLLRRQGEAESASRARVVLVTSALPNEGKSTLTLSLARAAAAEGLRVMVIDADLRKPTLHDLVGLKPGAGLVEVLRREVPLAEALATDPRLPLKILPGSKRLSQPTRLLGPDGIGALLTALRPSFDLVLVDSAPLVAVVDAKLLAKLADAVLFVVRYGSTRRDFCDSALRGLRESGATVAGAVLSQVDLRRHACSGAGDAGFAYAKLGEYYAD